MLITENEQLFVLRPTTLRLILNFVLKLLCIHPTQLSECLVIFCIQQLVKYDYELSLAQEKYESSFPHAYYSSRFRKHPKTTRISKAPAWEGKTNEEAPILIKAETLT